MKKIFCLCCLFCVVGASVLMPKYVDALGVTSKRVVFEGRKRSAVVTVINNSKEQRTYRLSWRHFKMTKDKALVAISDDELPEGLRPSKDMIRFSPRRFTLPSKSSQQVRMMLRTPAGIPDGEYRSHLAIIPEAPVQPYGDRREGTQLKSSQKAGAVLTMLAGASIPIIVRKGSLSADVKIEELSARRSGNTININFMVNRTGGKSVYGRLAFVCNAGANETLLKFIRGYTIYAEVSGRRGSYKETLLAPETGCSTLTARYQETDTPEGPLGNILAEATVAVQ